MDQSEADWGDWSLNNEADAAESVIKDADLGSSRKLLSAQSSQNLEDEENSLETNLYEDHTGANSAFEGDSDYMDDDALLAKDEPENQMGLVHCEYCGRSGVRDAFYSKTKRFCSRACSTNFTKLSSSGQAIVPESPKAVKSPPLKNKIHIQNPLLKSGVMRSFVWNDYMDANSHAAPVSSFKHCPLSGSWENMAVGMKLEVINVHAKSITPTNVYWIATVIRLEGYRALMHYEGMAQDTSLDFWVNLCSKDVHPVGWCAANGKPLMPPKIIENKYSDWRELLVRRLTGARTLPHDFDALVEEGLHSWPLTVGSQLEVVDKMCVSAMRVAAVQLAVGGRVRLQYEADAMYDNDTFWCHSFSSLIHPVGWSQLVGHKLHASSDYKRESLNKAALKKFGPLDATPDMFPKMKDPPVCPGVKFQAGMKLEAIDPLNLSTICVATVMKVLRNNYLMIGIDGSMAADGSDWFCYHSTSPCIFPVGFCELNTISLTPPRGFKGNFRWIDYLRDTKAPAAPVKLFNKEIPNHGFRVGQKIETVDLMEPRLICVSTITRVVGRLLRVHFDGWDDTYDQWIDCTSPDIYPVGWCEMVGYHLEGPRPKEQPYQPSAAAASHAARKRRAKSQMYRGPRKKRKAKLGNSPAQGILTPQTSIDETIDLTDEKEMRTPLTTSQPLSLSVSQPSSLPSISSMLTSPSKDLSPPMLSPRPSDAGLVSISTLNATGKQGPSGITRNASPYIPRLSHGPPEDPSIQIPPKSLQPVTPQSWSVFDVCQFLRINDCAAHCDSFRKKNIDGKALLLLTKEQIVNFIGMKMGPSLKIFELIQSLKNHSSTPQRLSKPLKHSPALQAHLLS